MKYYKELLLTKLTESGWELKVSDQSHDEWWLESIWIIKSLYQSYGTELFLLYLVDPMYEGTKKDSAVWAIGAFKEMPTQRPLEMGICTMDMVKGKYDIKLTNFVEKINRYRDSLK